MHFLLFCFLHPPQLTLCDAYHGNSSVSGALVIGWDVVSFASAQHASRELGAVSSPALSARELACWALWSLPPWDRDWFSMKTKTSC
jgi:hypothetical protein